MRRLLCFALVALAPSVVRAALPPAAVPLPDGAVARAFATTPTQLYFRLAGAESERLWVAANAPGGTHPVWDEDGEELVAPQVVAVHGEHVYVTAISAQQDAAGVTLFRTEGGVAHHVVDRAAHRGFASAGRLFFTTVLPDEGEALWLADEVGTRDTGIVLPRAAQATAFGSSLLYAGAGPGGVEPWQTNGVLASQLVDLAPGGAPSDPTDFALVGESATFLTRDAATTTLVRTDGTAAGTTAVTSWPHEPADDSFVRGAVGFARRLYFRRRDDAGAWALWSSDGTAAGTRAIAALDAAPAPMCGAGTSWFFVGRQGASAALFATDGIGATPLVTEAATRLDVLTTLGDRVYYPLDDTHLGGTNGTAAGTGSLALPPGLGPLEGAAGIFAVVGQSLYFTTSSASGTRLWTLSLPAPASDAAGAPAIGETAVAPAEDEGCSCKDKGGFFSPLLGLFLFAYAKRPRR